MKYIDLIPTYMTRSGKRRREGVASIPPHINLATGTADTTTERKVEVDGTAAEHGVRQDGRGRGTWRDAGRARKDLPTSSSPPSIDPAIAGVFGASEERGTCESERERLPACAQ